MPIFKSDLQERSFIGILQSRRSLICAAENYQDPRSAREKKEMPRRSMGDGPPVEKSCRRGSRRARLLRVKYRNYSTGSAKWEEQERGVNDLSSRSFGARWCFPFDVHTPRGSIKREYVWTWPLVDLPRGHWTKAGPTCRSLYSGTYIYVCTWHELLSLLPRLQNSPRGIADAHSTFRRCLFCAS